MEFKVVNSSIIIPWDPAAYLLLLDEQFIRKTAKQK